MPSRCALSAVMRWISLAFQSVIFWAYLPKRFSLLKLRCSKTMTSAPNFSAVSTMNFAVCWAMCLLMPSAFAQRAEFFRPPRRCDLRICPKMCDRRSFSTGRSKNLLPTTVPSIVIAEHVWQAAGKSGNPDNKKSAGYFPLRKAIILIKIFQFSFSINNPFSFSYHLIASMICR